MTYFCAELRFFRRFYRFRKFLHPFYLFFTQFQQFMDQLLRCSNDFNHFMCNTLRLAFKAAIAHFQRYRFLYRFHEFCVDFNTFHYFYNDFHYFPADFNHFLTYFCAELRFFRRFYRFRKFLHPFYLFFTQFQQFMDQLLRCSNDFNNFMCNTLRLAFRAAIAHFQPYRFLYRFHEFCVDFNTFNYFYNDFH